ncbi:hypothetical protein MD484_g5912, partial [Candolleomyces efflorescens]
MNFVSLQNNGSKKDIDGVQTVETHHCTPASADRRRAALAELENAEFSRHHAKICLTAGMGFFTDAYNVFAINLASVMLGYVYGQNQKLNKNQDLGLKIAAPVGIFCGQLFFGWLADRIGRRRAYGISLLIIIISTFAQALSASAPAVHIIGVLIVWRFLMGIGIGGNYPTSAAIPAEFAPARIRGRMMTAVLSAQGWGNLTAALVAYIVTTAYKNSILNSSSVTDLRAVDYMWRILIGFGCVPAVIALYQQIFTIPETPRFTVDVARDVGQAEGDVGFVKTGKKARIDPDAPIQRVDMTKASWDDFVRYLGRGRNLRNLLATSYSWFAFQLAFYGLGLNSPVVLAGFGFTISKPGVTDDVPAVYEILKNLSIGNIIICAAGLIPGMEIFGFIMLTGAISTWFIPETKGKRLEELCGEEDASEKEV